MVAAVAAEEEKEPPMRTVILSLVLSSLILVNFTSQDEAQPGMVLVPELELALGGTLDPTGLRQIPVVELALGGTLDPTGFVAIPSGALALGGTLDPTGAPALDPVLPKFDATQVHSEGGIHRS
jgi:hypothetical protein